MSRHYRAESKKTRSQGLRSPPDVLADERRRRQRPEQLWISHNELAKGPGHPFYKRVNELLEMKQFDEFAEKECARFYAKNQSRPSLTPGIYFRMLLVGYFEGIDSERGIAWRVADSMGLRYVGRRLTSSGA